MQQKKIDKKRADRKIVIVSVSIIVGLLLFIVAMSSWYYVPQGHVGVLFNKFYGFNYIEKPQGLGLKLPFIESVRKIDFRTQNLELLEEKELTPKDSNGIDFRQEILVRYRIDPNQASEFVELKGKQIESVVYTATRGASRNILGTYAQEDVPEKRGIIALEILEEIQLRLDSERSGRLNQDFIIIEAVDVRNTGFNLEIEEAIKTKQIQKQVAEQRQYELQARETEKKMAIVKAEGESQAIILVAQGKAKGIQLVNNAYQQMPPQYVAVKYAEAIKPTDKIYLGFESLMGASSNLGVLNYNKLLETTNYQKEIIAIEETQIINSTI